MLLPSCAAHDLKLPAFSRQAVVVTASSPTNARLVLLERDSIFAPWRQAGAPVQATIGRNGLATARSRGGALPAKSEGDGRTPAGVYPLLQAFGRPPAFPTRLPYIPITPLTEAVDDPASDFYNRIVTRDPASGDKWRSSEKMLRADHLYDLGIVIGYNTRRPAPGRGSCIFIHIWRTPGAATAGCIAMSRPGLEDLLRRLDPDAKPVVAIRAAP